MEGQVADLKRRIPILKRLIADCDRLAADLDRAVRNEEDRVNLRRSAGELRAHLAKAEKALIELGALDA